MQPLRLLFILLLVSSNPAFARPELSKVDPQVDEANPPAMAELTILNDGDRMTGLIYLANGPGPHPTVLLLHGFPGNEKNLDIAQAVRRAGFNAVFFHYRGAWGSEGNYSLLNVDDDVLMVLKFLRQTENARKYRVDVDKLSLLGHSLGGFTSLAAGHQDRDLICVGAMSPANLGVLATAIKTDDPEIRGFISYSNSLFMLRGFSGEAMRRQLSSAPMETLDTTGFGPGLRGKSVFMIVGEQDEVTPPAKMFDPVVEAYSQDEEIRLQHHKIPGDHSFSWSRVALTELVLNWLQEDCR